MDKLNTYTATLVEQYNDTKYLDYETPIITTYDVDEVNALPEISGNKNIGAVVLYEDVISIISNIANMKLKPLLVVQSNGFNPLANVANGTMANNLIYYCSNVMSAISDNQQITQVREGKILVAESVTMFKDVKFNTIRPYTIDVLFASTPRKPHIVQQSGEFLYQNNYEKEEMQYILDLIFNYANKMDYDYIVMDDFGCIQEENPPKEVVEMLNTLTKKYNIPGVAYSLRTPMQQVILSREKYEDNGVFQYYDTYINRI